MIAALIAFAVMAYTPGPPPARPPTVAEYLALCDADAQACSDRLFDLIYERSVGEQKVGFCLPDKDTPEAITATAVAWLRAHPELDGADTDATLLKAMEASYRCG
jgi:hypothetical protein